MVYAGLFSDFRVVFAAAFGALYAPVVMTGLHHMTNAIDSQLVTQYGGTALWPMIALSNIAQGSAVLAMSILQRANERAEQVNIPACVSCYLGVTEPALFGVNLKYKFPLVCGMIGSACAAMISVGCGVEAASIGVGGLPGILSIKPQFWLVFLLSMAVAVAVPFALTFLVGMRRLTADQRGLAEAPAPQAAPASGAPAPSAESVEPVERTLVSPLSGSVLPLSEMPDGMFASGAMGDGLAIEPDEGAGTVVAPADVELRSGLAAEAGSTVVATYRF